MTSCKAADSCMDSSVMPLQLAAPCASILGLLLQLVPLLLFYVVTNSLYAAAAALLLLMLRCAAPGAVTQADRQGECAADQAHEHAAQGLGSCQ